MSNPEIKATTPLEEILKTTSQYSCDSCRDSHCCKQFHPDLSEEEVQKILGYLGAEIKDSGKCFNKRSISFRERHTPRIYQYFCIFAVRNMGKDKARLEIEDRLRQPKTIKEKVMKTFHALRYWFRDEKLYCGIQEVKPLQCRVYHCKMPPEISSWEIEYFYVDRNDPKTIEAFRKDIETFNLPLLEGSVLQE